VAITAAAVGFLPGTFAAPPKREANHQAPAQDPIDRVKLRDLSALLQVEAVQKDVGLTAEQKRKLDDERARGATSSKEALKKALEDGVRDALQRARQMPPGGGAPPAAQRGGGADLSKVLVEQVEAFDKVAAGTLKPKQIRRLKQISVQAMGPAALLDRRVIRALELTPAQEDKIDSLLPDARSQAAGLGLGADEDQAREAKKIDKVWSATLEVLTPGQRARWDKLIGKKLPTADLRKISSLSAGAVKDLIPKLELKDLQNLVPPPAPPGP
jgi:hypothetical protein